MRSADVRNDIYINYGNNYNSQVTATDATSIALYGYKAESINSRVQGAVDAQAIADRYIDQRAYPIPAFQSITFPITSQEISNADRDDLLAVFMGMPVDIQNLPSQISGGAFQGYVEGWSWSTRFNEYATRGTVVCQMLSVESIRPLHPSARPSQGGYDFKLWQVF